jgi:LytS/YehU family sensor histidine kinase
MNPHFVFNALNGIQNFIMSQNKEAANEYLTRFAKLMRLFLESSRENFISLSQEIDMLRLYTDLEQMRFRDKFEVKFEVAEDLDLNQEVPSMLLQPFVENAINHGLIYLKEKGVLTLSFENDGQENLVIKIDDNGIGRKLPQFLRVIEQEVTGQGQWK